MQVSMSLTQETIDRLDKLRVDLRAKSRSDVVRILADDVPALTDGGKGQAIDYNATQGKLDAILDAINKVMVVNMKALNILPNHADTPKRINTVESTKKAVEPLTSYKHKTYFKKDMP